MDVHCDKSPDKRHEFFIFWDYNDAWPECIHCDKMFEWDEVFDKANAALRLTAEEAEDIDLAIGNALEAIHHDDLADADDYLSGVWGKLTIRYAARWRGDD